MEDVTSRDLFQAKEILQKWNDRAKEMSRMHVAARQFYGLLNNAFMIPTITMSSVAGTVNLVYASKPADDACAEKGFDAIQLAVGVLGIATATIATIYNFLSIGDKHQAHHMYAGEFEKLSRDIVVQLVLDDTCQQVYVDVGAFLKECQDRFDRFTTQAPIIPWWIRARSRSAPAFSSESNV